MESGEEKGMESIGGRNKRVGEGRREEEKEDGEQTGGAEVGRGEEKWGEKEEEEGGRTSFLGFSSCSNLLSWSVLQGHCQGSCSSSQRLCDQRELSQGLRGCNEKALTEGVKASKCPLLGTSPGGGCLSTTPHPFYAW